MKKLNNCVVDNCIPTSSSCVEWNGGDLPFLGICNGDSLNNIIIEIISKLKELAGEDISGFDIDELLNICNQKRPAEITLISILNLVKINQVCLKDFIDVLNEKLSELLIERGVVVNLKCYAEFDNLGNSLSITRQQLDQLIIDNLCAYKLKIEFIEGKIIDLQSQINIINDRLNTQSVPFKICLNDKEKTAQDNITDIATVLCQYEAALCKPGDINGAIGVFGLNEDDQWLLLDGDLINSINTKFDNQWENNPACLATSYNNSLLLIANLLTRIKYIETTCCRSSCEDITIDFDIKYLDCQTVLLFFGSKSFLPDGFKDYKPIGTKWEIIDGLGNKAVKYIKLYQEVFSQPDILVDGYELDLSTTPINTQSGFVMSADVALYNEKTGQLCIKCVSVQGAACPADCCKVCFTSTTPNSELIITYTSL
jgi:hypothetical protein